MAMHPYCPSSLLLPDFVPIEYSPARISLVLCSYSAIIFAIGWKLSGTRRHLGTFDRLLVIWFTTTGLVYIFMKGYWVFTPDFYEHRPSQPVTRFINEFWKEYGKGDSRFISRFSALVVTEGFTAVVEGPASLLATYAILYNKPYAHPLQFAASLTKFYNGFIYFTTAYLARTSFNVPGPVYFWGYFVAVKGIFVVVPFVIVCRSWIYLVEAFASKNSSGRTSLEKKHF
ncbi:cholestenol Delta-isomerase [Marchantia polymorpha subsp. ruderalis]|uniref:EXPERA domain-containing protein n=2 Tax=Marchantia polymorpha TaxID=3197 RepID=A0A176VIV7_MARPO|nr:hypothetical protein AXG93_2964s1210 [Marchantia polymorpha subsp. ruderalis]PTQ35323.1 hypothetical protein MARPO_0072s0066 [Marchantia polymorpha]BBN03328.1 hypothetical protein Mp_2g22650 [Marchantia polymorpha subsp. ruderalis]|eukprot:PTQ35323.1 hypothetical protein MARPO_0072s0066 [Marchantia polymorpha]